MSGNGNGERKTGVIVERVKRELADLSPERAEAILTLVLVEMRETREMLAKAAEPAAPRLDTGSSLRA